MPRYSFLVVDDSSLTARKLGDILAELGHSVVATAATGAEAVQAFHRCKPDFVSMDITMPGMDGIQATQDIMSEFPDAKIIIVTSHGQEGMVMKAIKAGARSYILKPVKPEKLRSVIEQLTKTGN